MQPFFIGITGGTGSGKTTFANMIAQDFGRNVLIISQDMYYKDQRNQPLESRKKANMDCPDAVDFDLLIAHIKQLKKGKSIDSPLYNFTEHVREEKSITLEPHGVIVIEGLLVLSVKAMRDLLDLKIYVDVDSDLRVSRRILRDVKEGREPDLEGSIEQYLLSAYPMHKRYVEPQRNYADLIIPWNVMEKESVETVVARIKSELDERNIKS